MRKSLLKTIATIGMVVTSLISISATNVFASGTAEWTATGNFSTYTYSKNAPTTTWGDLSFTANNTNSYIDATDTTMAYLKVSQNVSFKLADCKLNDVITVTYTTTKNDDARQLKFTDETGTTSVNLKKTGSTLGAESRTVEYTMKSDGDLTIAASGDTIGIISIARAESGAAIMVNPSELSIIPGNSNTFTASISNNTSEATLNTPSVDSTASPYIVINKKSENEYNVTVKSDTPETITNATITLSASDNAIENKTVTVKIAHPAGTFVAENATEITEGTDNTAFGAEKTINGFTFNASVKTRTDLTKVGKNCVQIPTSGNVTFTAIAGSVITAEFSSTAKVNTSTAVIKTPSNADLISQSTKGGYASNGLQYISVIAPTNGTYTLTSSSGEIRVYTISVTPATELSLADCNDNVLNGKVIVNGTTAYVIVAVSERDAANDSLNAVIGTKKVNFEKGYKAVKANNTTINAEDLTANDNQPAKLLYGIKITGLTSGTQEEVIKHFAVEQ